ncbi:MAG TPA: hypothetical protein VLH14_01015, partial [Patescibacteria group bacterium]|nr:hypothetical protein [Patescibacteria group bacterium]
EILRTKDSWQSSKALANADDFAGKALVMIGTEDKVIPWGVIGALTTAFKQSASETRIEVLRGVAHELPTWIPEHETVCGQLFEYLVN